MGRFLELLRRTAMMVSPRGRSYLLEYVTFYTLFLSMRALLRPRLDIPGVGHTQGFHEMRVHRTAVRTGQSVAVVRVEVQPLVGRQDRLPAAVALKRESKRDIRLNEAPGQLFVG